MTEQDILALDNPRIEIKGDVCTLFKLVSAGGENKRDVSHTIPNRVVVQIKRLHNMIVVKEEGYQLWATKEYFEAQLSMLMSKYESLVATINITEGAIIRVREALEE